LPIIKPESLPPKFFDCTQKTKVSKNAVGAKIQGLASDGDQESSSSKESDEEEEELSD